MYAIRSYYAASKIIGGVSEIAAGFALNEPLYSSFSSGRYSYAFSFTGLSALYLFTVVYPEISTPSSYFKRSQGFNLNLTQDNTQTKQYPVNRNNFV